MSILEAITLATFLGLLLVLVIGGVVTKDI